MSHYTIMRCTENGSDKLWVCAEKGTQHQAWWGESKFSAGVSGSLQTKVCSGYGWKKAQTKVRKGYVELPGATFDEATRQVRLGSSQTQSAAQAVNDIPPAFSYRIDMKHKNFAEIQAYIAECSEALEQSPESITRFAEAFDQLSVVRQITEQQSAGMQPYSETLLGAILLFGLRRRFGVLVANDDNSLLSERFSDFIDHEVKHFIEAATPLNPHEVTLSEIKPLAIALGAIDPPVDFSAIQSEKPAAFF